MAFTSAQTASIRTYLGYPAIYRFANPRLESAIVLAAADDDVSAQVITILGNIAGVLTQIQGVALVSAGVTSLDKGDVSLDVGNAQTRGMVRIGRMWVAQLSGIFGVPVGTDVFGAVGYGGDGWMATNGMGHLTGLA